MTIPIRYAGIRKDRTKVTGKTTVGDLAGFVRDRYTRGWRRLTVTDPAGHLLGSIGPKVEGGGRVWWVA